MSDNTGLRVRLGDLHKELAAEAKALPGKVSLNTYIITLLTTHPERKRKEAKAKK